ncbi:MAG: hypothetical protein AAGF75_10120, partial [Cyanobacteria bacterium P01_H01_bin.130]
FDANEPGWGLGIQQQNDLEFAAIYFYATDDLPAWVVSTDPAALASGSSPVAVAEVHCPGCVWSTPALSNAGTLERSFSGDTTGTLTLDASTDRGGPSERQQSVNGASTERQRGVNPKRSPLFCR